MTMNDDLISRSALSESLEWADADVCEDYGDGYSEWGFTISSIRELLQKIPAVDAVIPVRCKECKHGRKSDHAYAVDTAKPLCECNFMYGPHQWHEYCSWGKRRADE